MGPYLLLVEINCHPIPLPEKVFTDNEVHVISNKILFLIWLHLSENYKKYMQNVSNQLCVPSIGLNIQIFLCEELEDTYTYNGAEFMKYC